MLYGIVEEGIVKWLWGSLGLCVCAVPVFGSKLFGGMGGSSVIDFGSRTEGNSAVHLSLISPIAD
jgi:ATP-binding cassette subfamily D (ALD) long-chain fatty acid import protein